MNGRYEIRLTGAGGQGVISASVILAEAAVLSGLHAAQTQSYGPEARGGLCRAEVVISRNEILYPKVKCPDFLLALTQESLNKYSGQVAAQATVLADSSLKLPDGAETSLHSEGTEAALCAGAVFITLPVLETAAVTLKSPMSSNIVAAGAINALLNLFDDKALEQSVKMHIPKGTEEINLRALKAGADLVKDREIRTGNHI